MRLLPVFAFLLIAACSACKQQNYYSVSPAVAHEEPAPEQVYTYVEQMPELPGGGGMQAIVNDFFKRFDLPEAAIEQGYGRSSIFFEVGSDGFVRHVRIVHSSESPALDSALLATARSFPRFIPGRQGGKAVAVSFTMPIACILPNR